jgi:flavin reductase (DIM6/NTAB) family NADH-FMN oxidoreductase RutF
MLGLGAISQTTINLLRTKQCVLNLASDGMADAVNALARTTGSKEVLTAEPDEGYKYFKRINGYVYVQDKFGRAGLKPLNRIWFAQRE